MGFFDGWLRRPPEDDRSDGPLVLNPAVERPLKGLQLLFPGRLRDLGLSASRISRGLRAYHPWLSSARCELNTADRDAPFGLAGWDDHVVKIVCFSHPLDSDIVERCVRPAHYAAELRQLARRHRSHVLLYYAGYHRSALEQYVALGTLAGVLGACGAVIVLNENAQTSVPADVLTAAQYLGDRLELLRALPLPTLYMGFVKAEVAGWRGVWMRTHAGALMGLPDLALLAEDHQQGALVFDLFTSVLNYLLTSGETCRVGDTMQVGSERFFRLRAPAPEETFLVQEAELLVLERITADEIAS